MMEEYLVHWPFITATAVLYVCVKTLRTGPLSAQRAKTVPWVRAVRQWFPLPLQVIVAGTGLGFIPGMPTSPGIEGGSSTVLYYAGAGAASILWRNVYREWQKYKKLPSD